MTTMEERALNITTVFDMGFAWAMALRGQTLEDSRAVGRTLGRDIFDPIRAPLEEHTRLLGFDSFQDADEGIWQCKRIIHAALEDMGVGLREQAAYQMGLEDARDAILALLREQGPTDHIGGLSLSDLYKDDDK